jgi:hypothetical protein
MRVPQNRPTKCPPKGGQTDTPPRPLLDDPSARVHAPHAARHEKRPPLKGRHLEAPACHALPLTSASSRAAILRRRQSALLVTIESSAPVRAGQTTALRDRQSSGGECKLVANYRVEAGVSRGSHLAAEFEEIRENSPAVAHFRIHTCGSLEILRAAASCPGRAADTQRRSESVSGVPSRENTRRQPTCTRSSTRLRMPSAALPKSGRPNLFDPHPSLACAIAQKQP